MVPTSRPGCWAACGRWHRRWRRLSCLRHEAPAPCTGTRRHYLAVSVSLLPAEHAETSLLSEGFQQGKYLEGPQEVALAIAEPGF